jgi:hypothetical protein
MLSVVVTTRYFSTRCTVRSIYGGRLRLISGTTLLDRIPIFNDFGRRSSQFSVV